MSHYYKDVINSLSRSLDTIIEDQSLRIEHQKIYGENELQTCDIEEGGPFIWQLTGVTPATAIPRG